MRRWTSLAPANLLEQFHGYKIFHQHSANATIGANGVRVSPKEMTRKACIRNEYFRSLGLA